MWPFKGTAAAVAAAFMCGGPSRRRWRAMSPMSPMSAMENHHDIAAGSADATDQEKNVLSRNDDNPARRLARGALCSNPQSHCSTGREKAQLKLNLETERLYEAEATESRFISITS